MKILIVAPAFPFPANDGGKIVINNTYQGLKKYLNMDVEFICVNKNPIDPTLVKNFDDSKKTTVLYDKNITGISRVIRAFFFNHSYLISKFYSSDLLKVMKKKIESNNYDIVHFEGLHSALYALKISGKTESKIVLRLLNIESQIIGRLLPKTKNLFKKFFLLREYLLIKRLERKTFNEIKNIIFISDDDYKLFRDSSKNNYNYLISPVALDLEKYSFDCRIKSLDLLFLGSMDWYPNEEAVLWFYKNVFSVLSDKYPKLKLYVVGKNPSIQVQSISSEKVIVTGAVESIFPYTECTGIFVVPIHIGGGMRVKIIEMMAIGRVIVSTSIGAEGINYTNKENIIIANSATEFIISIESLMASADEMKKIAINAEKIVKDNYSLKNAVLSLKNFYYKAI